VGVIERTRDLAPDRDRFRQGQGTCSSKAVVKRLAGHVLEDDRRRLVIVDDVVHGDDARVAQSCGSSRLGNESRSGGRVRQKVRVEELDRDGSIEPLVMCAPDLGHPAPTEPLLEAVSVEQAPADRERAAAG
jgi:hypothetical protein